MDFLYKNLKKYKLTIIKDMSTLLLSFILFSEISFIPYFFVIPITLGICVFLSFFTKKNKKFTFYSLLENIIYFCTYIFIFPFILFFIYALIDEEIVFYEENILSKIQSKKSISKILSNYKKGFINIKTDFLLSDFFASKFFFKW